ncbi:MAG: peptidoglycan-associated lipoprotein Pal [Burkholderiales bacterium]
MKRLLATFAVVGLLVGCASTPKDDQPAAKVEDARPTAPSTTAPAQPKGPPEAKAKPVTPDRVSGDPLKDPANILSRRSVFFDYDSNVVKEEFKPVVSAHAGFLSKNRNRRVTIQGNTDERGSREYNIALGQRRADAVKQMMTLLGAPSAQIETVSFGEEKPRQQGSNEQAWAENRRADILYDGE